MLRHTLQESDARDRKPVLLHYCSPACCLSSFATPLRFKAFCKKYAEVSWKCILTKLSSFHRGSEGHQREEYNVCSDDTAFQCSPYQKPITIIQKSSKTISDWLDTMITNQVVLLLALSMLWPSSAMPFTPENIGKLFGMPESDGRILQRSKRGWMWNQFFLLEEYTGNDHQYVGKVKCPNTSSAD